MELLLKAEKVRHVDRIPVASAGYEPSEWAYAFDGKEARQCFRTHDEEAAPYHGGISRDPDAVVRTIQTKACVWVLCTHYRPSQRQPQLVSQAKLLTRRGTIGAEECVILQREKRATDYVTVESFWLDPKHEFCLRRYVHQWGRIALKQIDVAYKQDPLHGPIPTGWKDVRHTASGEFEESYEATVLTGLVNHQLPDDRFRIEFPVGTFVRDSVNTTRTEPLEYVVRPRMSVEEAVRSDKQRLQGAWKLVSGAISGRSGRAEANGRWIIAGEKIVMELKDRREGKFTIDPAKLPRHIDLITTSSDGTKTEQICGVYELSGDYLYACLAPGDEPRPGYLHASPGTGQVSVLLKRAR
jgi:uncharacterized protein (TIGR03067 family)